MNWGNFIVKSRDIFRGLGRNAREGAKTIGKGIRNAASGIRKDVSGGAWQPSSSPSSSWGNNLASMESAARNALNHGRGTGAIVGPGAQEHIYKSPYTGRVEDVWTRGNAAHVLPGSQTSIARSSGVSTPSPRSTIATGQNNGPSPSYVDNWIRQHYSHRTPTHVAPKRAISMPGVSRTQPSAPSMRRREAGVTPTPPVSRIERIKPSNNAPVESSAISSYHRSSIPTPPSVRRTPLSVGRVPTSLILSELKKGRKGKPGYVSLPEGRAYEARPKKQKIAEI